MAGLKKHRAITVYGRGGQGAVTSSEVLAIASFYDGLNCQAFPSFGVERRGAPVTAYARISEKPIRIRQQVYNPNYVIVLDPSLTEAIDVGAGTDENSIILINSDKNPQDFKLKTKAKVYTVNVTKKALEVIGKPFVNIAILGFFSYITKEISLESLKKAVDEAFESKPKIAELNKKAIEAVFDACKDNICLKN